MAWFPEFETPEYQAHLEKKIEDEARSWNEYCEERIEFQCREGRGGKMMDSLIPAPKHDYKAICDSRSCRHSSYSYPDSASPLGFWDCAKLDDISDEVLETVAPGEDDEGIPMCPYYEPLTPEEIKELEECPVEYPEQNDSYKDAKK